MNRLKSYLRLRKNSFEKFRKQTESKTSTIEGQVENIGDKLCKEIEKNNLTIEKVISDILQFCNDGSDKLAALYRSWLSLHLALGLCYQYRVADKFIVRKVLYELLKYSHGIDIGIFMRDLLRVIDMKTESQSLNKSTYFLKMCAGFKVELNKDEAESKILIGNNRLLYAEFLAAGSCYYLDLPTGQPYLLFDHNIPQSVEPSTLLLACENLKPELVLLLLRHGASPRGRPLDYILQTLSSIRILRDVAHLPFSSSPVELMQQCLLYSLRVVTGLNLQFFGQTIHHPHHHELYYVNDDVITYLPDQCYETPASLKHLCRCAVRDRLLDCDNIPMGINDLDVPSALQNYIDLME